MRHVSAALLLAAIAIPANAQDAAPHPAREACRTDYQTLCSGVQPGGGRVIACFREHRAQLSGSCVEALKAARQVHSQGG
jgi:hypothetical protein